MNAAENNAIERLMDAVKENCTRIDGRIDTHKEEWSRRMDKVEADTMECKLWRAQTRGTLLAVSALGSLVGSVLSALAVYVITHRP